MELNELFSPCNMWQQRQNLIKTTDRYTKRDDYEAVLKRPMTGKLSAFDYRGSYPPLKKNGGDLPCLIDRDGRRTKYTIYLSRLFLRPPPNWSLLLAVSAAAGPTPVSGRALNIRGMEMQMPDACGLQRSLKPGCEVNSQFRNQTQNFMLDYSQVKRRLESSTKHGVALVLDASPTARLLLFAVSHAPQ